MLNPDGVIIGNFRTSFCGRDLNREFHDPNPVLQPIVHAIEELVDTL